MVMTTESVPQPKGNTVAEAKKTGAEKEEPKAQAKLARAGESSDAGVQNLLALRGIHASNQDADKVAELDAQLAELGYTAQ
jgi:hypothetical protein